MTGRIQILIVCQDSNFGGALSSFAQAAGMAVAGIADSIPAFVELSKSESVDVGVVIDPVQFPPEQVVDAAPEVALLMIGLTSDPTLMIASVEAGVLGYAGKEATFEELVEAIRSVASGVAVIPPQMLGSLLRHVVGRQRLQRQRREHLRVLSPRERQIFELTARGLDRNAVAARLFISPATVRTHVQNVFRKLDLHSMAELVSLAAECGLDVGGGDQGDNE